MCDPCLRRRHPRRPYANAATAVITKNTGTGQRDLPEVPALPAASVPGARFALDGLWSGAGVINDPAAVSCGYNTEDGGWEFSVVSPSVPADGVHATHDDFGLQAILFESIQRDGSFEGNAQVVIFFTDSAGTYVQMYAPDGDSVDVRVNEDKTEVAFTMINAPANARTDSSPTTVVGTLTCPNRP